MIIALEKQIRRRFLCCRTSTALTNDVPEHEVFRFFVSETFYYIAYILGNYGHGHGQGGRSCATTEPPLYYM